MKRLSQRGEGSIVIIVLVGLVAIGAASYFAYRQGQQHKAALPTPTATAISANLTHFRSSIDTLSFDYPSSWKSTLAVQTEPASSLKVLSGSITSPGGLVIHVIDPATGLGGACSEPCTVTTHTSFKELHQLVTGMPIYIAEQKIYDPKNPNYPVQRRLGIVQEDGYFKFGSDYVGYPPYPLFNAKANAQVSDPGTRLVMIYANYAAETSQSTFSDQKANLSDTAYFSTPDMQAALTVFRSIKY